MTFRNKKIEAVELLEEDEHNGTCALHYTFDGSYGPNLLHTCYATRALLIYDMDADGCGSSPYYQLIAIEDMDNLKGEYDPITSTVKRWYNDVPMLEPMCWIADNII